MKRLLLLRHAKSLRDDAIKDRERPLNARGRADAPRMGIFMHHEQWMPDLVLSSPSARTLETWELLSPELGATGSMKKVDALYLAGDNAIAKTIKAVEDSVSTLLVIGHNPGLEDCAKRLMREPQSAKERDRAAKLEEKFPTCTLAVLDFEIEDWNGLADHAGALTAFVRPKDLPQG